MEKKKIATKRFEVFFKGSMAAITTAAAVAGRTISFLLSAASWIGLIVTLGLVVREWLKVDEVIGETEESFDLLNDKIESTNDELKHFNQIQNVLNDNGKATISTMENIGKAMSNIGSVSLGKVLEGSDDKFGDLASMRKQASDAKREYESLEGAISSAAFAGNAGDVRALQLHQETLKKGYKSATAFLEKNFDEHVEGLGLKPALDLLERERTMVLLNSDAKIAGSAVALRYVTAINAVTAGTAGSLPELLAAREAFKNLATEVGTLTNINKLAAEGYDALRTKLFPKSEYANYLTTLEEQLRLSSQVKTNNLEEKASIDAKIASIGAEIALVKELRDQKLRHEQESRLLDVVQKKSAPDIEFPGLKKRREELNKVANAELKLNQMRDQAQLKRDMLQTVVNPTEAQLAEMEKINGELILQEDLVRRANLALTDGHKITKTMAGAIESNMTTAFAGLIDGTMTVKEAFASMAQGILKALAQVIAELITVKLLKMAIGAFSFGGSAGDMQGVTGNYSQPTMMGSTSAYARNGGVFSEGAKVQGYSAGGVASGSTSGYPAVLHGTEAVVPLPNGNSIPVEMKGAGSGTTNNNITVNVASDGQTTTQGGKGMDMDKMGAAVAAAVQKELQNQKRSGGILNPYGAA